MENPNLYTPQDDIQFQKPYIDMDEWRDEPIRHRYFHGGFEGSELRFSFFFPEKAGYQGRFFHFMAPVQGDENASVGRRGEEDKISFAITHGAYFVETNMGVAIPFAPIPDPTIIYRASAAAAAFSRKIAKDFYGDHRAYGYIYGGSGGGFKSISCVENTDIWDGAVPYVIGSPMAIPNCFTVRAHARRVLRHKLAQIADAVEPGGSGNPYAGLTDEERDALEEVTQMGYPLKSWFFYHDMDDGSLPVLTPAIYAMDAKYFDDFWKLPGYLGADPIGSAVRDRIQHKSTIAEVYLPQMSTTVPADNGKTGVDEAWKRLCGLANANGKPLIRLDSAPLGDDLYLYGTMLELLTGKAAGYKVPLDDMKNGVAVVGQGFGLTDMMEKLALIQPGDEVILDNSDYIAVQTYHRHQVPDESYEGWKQFRDENGCPLYPQRAMLLGPIVALGGAGSIQSGAFEGKMIVVASLMDESAFPWQADWYRTRVQAAFGSEETKHFRLWFTDNALHDDRMTTQDELHVVSYLGALHQALLDLSDWVEKGIDPCESSVYQVKEGQLSMPENAFQRKGVQPVVCLKVNDAQCITVQSGQIVHFSASIQVPPGAGCVVCAEWSFEGDSNFSRAENIVTQTTFCEELALEAMHTFQQSGTYFPVLRVCASRQGREDRFTQIKNISRVRVIVE